MHICSCCTSFHSITSIVIIVRQFVLYFVVPTKGQDLSTGVNSRSSRLTIPNVSVPTMIVIFHFGLRCSTILYSMDGITMISLIEIPRFLICLFRIKWYHPIDYRTSVVIERRSVCKANYIILSSATIVNIKAVI